MRGAPNRGPLKLPMSIYTGIPNPANIERTEPKHTLVVKDPNRRMRLRGSNMNRRRPIVNALRRASQERR